MTTFTTIGPFELNWVTEQYKCRLSQFISFGLLAWLQALNIFWLFFILRIAYRFVVDKTADDDRSEADDSELELQREEMDRKKEELRQLTEKSEETPVLLKTTNGAVRVNGGAKKVST